MSQVSRPYQLALGAALLLVVVYFFALRPKPLAAVKPSAATPAATAPASTAGSVPAQTGFGKAVQKARAAHNAETASGAQVNAATGGAAVTPTTSTPATSAAGATATTGAPAKHTAVRPTQIVTHTRGLPASVARPLSKREIVVLLFWNPGSSDDRAVRDELRSFAGSHGKVAVVAAPISQVSRYSAITNGVQITQSPTVLVIDRSRQAQVLTGFVDTGEIARAVQTAALAH